MKPQPVPFGEWRPDIALTDTQFASEVENVFAGVNSYLPFPSLAAFSASSLSDAGNDQYTKALLRFGGVDGGTVITDDNVGGSAHIWTASGNANTDTGDYKFAPSSLACDGTGDYVSTPDHADFALGTSNFTIEFWFRVNSTGTLMYAAGQGDGVTPTNTSFTISRNSSGFMTASVYHGGGNTFVLGTTAYTLASNPGWHHYRLVRSQNNLMQFVDGVQEGITATLATPIINNSTQVLTVGRAPAGSQTWNGWIDEFRIDVGIARSVSNFSVPVVPYFNAGGRVCGLYSARMNDGTWKIYVGTTTKLYSWSLAGFVDISRTTGGPYNVPPGDMWVFEESGNHVVAVNVNDDPQWADIDSGSAFEELPGNPPKAGHVKQIGDFLFLSRLVEGGTTGAGTPVNNRSIVWCSINDITGWTIGVNLCDMQEFPDNGPVQGIAGAEIGYVVQDRGIRTLQFLPGDTTFIFNFSRVIHDRGSVSKYGFTSLGNVLHFLSEDGFYAVVGQQVTPTGSDKVNQWFLDHSDVTRRNVVHAIAGVNKPRIVWAYHAFEGSQTYDKLIIFDWTNQRWAKASERAQVWGLLASAGLDLDTPPDGIPGDEPGDEFLDSTARGLDSFAYVGGRPLIGGVNPDGYLSAITGPALPATMETAEVHLVPGRRAFVSEVYPLDDANAPGTVTAGIRERLQDGTPVFLPPVDVEITGSAGLFSSSRLHRFRRSIPAEATWTHAQGVLVEAQQDGDIA